MSPVTFRPAKREGIPLLLAVVGGTGSGKSMSALRLAKGLAGGQKFAFIDTEARRGLHYADMFDFDHADLAAPFRPAAYLDAIKTADAAGYPVIVVDTMSHVWDGVGGVLEWHDELMGGKENKKLSSWILPKTEHRKLVSQLLQLKSHLVVALRAQQKVEMVKVDGKWEIVPKKSLTGLDGWIPICERNFPFELTMSLLLTADRPGVPHPVKLQEQHRPFVPLDAPITEATGAALGRWAAGAEKSAEPEATGEIDATAKALEESVLALASSDEAREAAKGVIGRQRAKYEADPGAFIAWLGAAYEKKKAEAAERDQVEIQL